MAVTAFDPISQAGIASQLRYRPEVGLVEEPVDAAVVLVVVDRIDDQSLQAIRAAGRRGGARVVVVATQIDSRDLLTAVEAGCCGVLRRVEAVPERLITAVRVAVAGDGTLPPDLLGRLLEQIGRLQRDALGPLLTPGLSKREVAVLRMVADGKATSEIASTLCYSERTVKNILHDVTTRLQVRNRAQAVAYAVREGLI
ncbi:helix-turn-helix transcriptional regulator [Amycolatopsis taiwanensis]|uniref:helix-turn-helix transcriptional regulator n=1 Tax=Amycolatopsis taiwanensis TaxID=342230 RepID=UPI0025539FA7|nr:response regulator transcription factor [Amycolatopsis taiwanensis]